MDKIDLKASIENNLEIFFKEYGYELVKNIPPDVIEFKKLTHQGSDGVVVGITTTNKKHKVNYYAYKQFTSIQTILSKLLEICEKLNWNLESHDFTISYELINGINRTSYLPKIISDEDAINNLNTIKEYLKDTLLPLTQKYNDISLINSEINGDDFWETDWRKPFNLGGNFEYKRIIIAHLANLTEDEFDVVVQKQRAIIESKLNGEYGDDFKDVIKTQDVLVKLLKS